MDKKKETARSTVDVGKIWEMVLHVVIYWAESSRVQMLHRMRHNAQVDQ